MLEAAQPSRDGFAFSLTIAACSCVALLGRVFKNVDLQNLAANRPTVSGVQATSERPYQRAGTYREAPRRRCANV